MGAANVKLVYAVWPDLADRPFRLLSYMALTATDRDPYPKYWAGPEPLALALGWTPGQLADTAVRELAYRAVRRALTSLRVAGALETIEAPAKGRNACYALHLDPQRRSLSGRNVGRSAVERRSLSDRRADADTVFLDRKIRTRPKEEVVVARTDAEVVARGPDLPVVDGQRADDTQSVKPRQPGLWPRAVGE